MTLTQLGHPVLRRKAKPVRRVGDRQLQTLIKKMMQDMRRARGVGIAAPQVGKSLRLFIVASRPNPRYPSAPNMKPLAMINPRLLAHSRTTHTAWEGCLSIPGIRGQVPRYNKIQIQYISESGKVEKMTLTGFVARIFQHELDHINGTVFLDRVQETRTLVTEKEYRKLIKTKSYSRR